MQTAVDQLVNHVSLVLDCSSSMSMHERKVLEVAKSEIANLAKKSEDMCQDTRISIYSFADKVNCLVYDKDVLRLPSIDRYYKIGGMTALIDATIKSIDDLGKAQQMYGDHAFLQIVVTDGHENQSSYGARELTSKLNSLADNWTVATLVPDQQSLQAAVNWGFSRDNVGTWDTSSAKGFEAVGNTIRTATDTFYTNRASGIRGSKSIFTLNTQKLNTVAVNASLVPVRKELYTVHPCTDKVRADDFMTAKCKRFEIGRLFYELTKPEEIQYQKQVMIKDKDTGMVYSGARSILGLPDTNVKVDPIYHNKYKIFVQSTAPNRNLMPNTEVLILR